MNGVGLAGTVTGIERAIEQLNKRGFDLPESTYYKLIKTVCGAHDELLALEHLVIEGPHVPFEQKIIPLASKESARINGPKTSRKVVKTKKR